jgi:hypothetical protein
MLEESSEKASRIKDFLYRFSCISPEFNRNFYYFTSYFVFESFSNNEKFKLFSNQEK